MMTRLYIVAILLATSTAALGQSQIILDEGAINDGFNEGINAVTLFTSQNTISSGVFNFESDSGTDHAQITHLPYTHQFEELKDGTVPEISLVIGHSKVTGSVPAPSGTGIDDFSRIETTSIGAGWGLSIPVIDQFTLIPRMLISYSHIDRKYDFNNEFSQTYLQPLDREAFNTWFDVMTYTPSIELRYDFPVNRHGKAPTQNTFTARAHYAHLFNNSITSKSDIIDISSNTGHLQTTIEAMLPVGEELRGYSLFVRPFIVRSDIYGAARRALSFSYFHEVGTELVFSDPNAPWYARGFSLGGSYSFGEDVDGWRIGVGFGITY